MGFEFPSSEEWLLRGGKIRYGESNLPAWTLADDKIDELETLLWESCDRIGKEVPERYAAFLTWLRVEARVGGFLCPCTVDAFAEEMRKYPSFVGIPEKNQRKLAEWVVRKAETFDIHVTDESFE